MTETEGSRDAPRQAGRWSGNLGGIALMTISTVCMACMYVAIRKVPGEIHPFEVAFFRNFLALLLLLGWHRSRFFGYFRTAHLKLHLLRGGLNVVAMLMFFTAVLITPLAEVAALGFTAPLFASLLAIVVLRERLRWHRLLVIAFGFVGAVVILRPGFAAVGQGPVLLLMSAALWSVTMLVIKMIARTDSSVTITVYMGSVMAPLSLLAALWFWQWPTLEQLGWFVVISALGTLGQVSLAQSFRIAEVTAVLPLDFMKLVWGSLLGFFIFAEIPDLFTWVGGVMIFSSTTYLALRESRTPRPNAADPAAQPTPSR